jgi:hypothetical protein
MRGGVDYISFHLPSRPRRLEILSLHSRTPVRVKKKRVERQAKNSPISGVAEDSMPRRDQNSEFLSPEFIRGHKIFSSAGLHRYRAKRL